MNATICRLDLVNTQANTSHVTFRALVISLILAALLISAVSVRPQQPAARPPLSDPSIHLSPAEIAIYTHAKTLMDWTPHQIRGIVTMDKLRPAGNQNQLPMVLERVGQTAARMFRDFPQIACDEEIYSEAHGEMHNLKKDQKFRYIVIPRTVGDLPAFTEYRTDFRGRPTDASGTIDDIFITSNYASTWLYLSPADQRGSLFRHFGIQTIRKRECHVVGFAQVPERACRAGTINIGDKSATVLVQGLAWIDSQSFEVLRIQIWLLAPRTDIGLNYQASTVDFYPQQPSGAERTLWLPRDVKVVIYYRGILARNTHHYSNFKLFRVESTIKPGE